MRHEDMLPDGKTRSIVEAAERDRNVVAVARLPEQLRSAFAAEPSPRNGRGPEPAQLGALDREGVRRTGRVGAYACGGSPAHGAMADRHLAQGTTDFEPDRTTQAAPCRRLCFIGIDHVLWTRACQGGEYDYISSPIVLFGKKQPMFAILRHWAALSRIAYRRRQATEQLLRLSDAQLLDVGLERGMIEDHVNGALPWDRYEPVPTQSYSAFLQGCG